MAKTTINDKRKQIIAHRSWDLDQLLFFGLTRIAREYKKLAFQENEMSIETLERLVLLTKSLAALKKDNGIQAVIDRRKRKAPQQKPEDLAHDVLNAEDEPSGTDDAMSKGNASPSNQSYNLPSTLTPASDTNQPPK